MIARRPLLAALSLMPSLLAGAARAEGELDRVQKKVFTAKSFHLESGVVMAEIVIAYETYGTLAPDGRTLVSSYEKRRSIDAPGCPTPNLVGSATTGMGSLFSICY